MSPPRLYFFAVYVLSWLLFGLCAVVVNLVCAALLLLPRRARYGPVVREALRRFFVAWSAWLDFTGLVRVRWHGFDHIPLRGPAVWVANHPGLLDATFLLARLPDVVCVFKPSIRLNPFLGPAALMAGHVACGTGLDFIRATVGKIAEGRTLLIFPEGTRTARDTTLNSCKTGFALIAERAAVPIQIVVIRASRDLLPRERRWWQIPRFPSTVDIVADERIEPDPFRPARSVAAFVEQRLSGQLAAATPCAV